MLVAVAAPADRLVSDDPRAAFCRAHFTRYPRWVDGNGESRALSTHPNYDICRNYSRRAAEGLLWPLVESWAFDLATFVYELTDEIGLLPEKWYYIQPRDETTPVGPGNVKWVPVGWRKSRRAQAARASREHKLVPTGDGATVTQAFVDSLSHAGACESTWMPLLDCPCTSAARELAEGW